MNNVLVDNVLVVSPYPPPRDGIGEHTKNLARELSKDHNVYVLAPGRGGEEKTDVDGRTVHVLRILGAGRRRLRRRILEIGPAWAYIQYTISSYGSCIRGVHHAARILDEAGCGYAVGYHEPNREPKSLPWLGGRIYKNMLSMGGQPIVFTENAGSALRELGGVPVVIPHGIKEVREAAAAGEFLEERTGERRYCLAFGFIHKDKGTQHLIEAVADLNGRGEDLRVVVAGEVRVRRGIFKIKERGDRRYLEGLKRLAGELGVDVEFRAGLEDSEIGDELRAADVNVLPYTNGTQSGVASLITGAGRGAVASDLAGLVEQLRDSAVYARAGDSAALAAAIHLALTPTKRAELDKAARELLRTGSYRQVAEQIRQAAGEPSKTR